MLPKYRTVIFVNANSRISAKPLDLPETLSPQKFIQNSIKQFSIYIFNLWNIEKKEFKEHEAI